MAKSMQMDDNIDFVTAETDQESCSGTGLDSEKESDNSNIDYLSDNESQIQFVHSQQVQCTTNDNDDDDGMSNVNKANVNHDNNAELVLVDSAKNDKFENNDDDQINSDEDTLGASKSYSTPQGKKQRVRSSDSSGDSDNDEEEATPQHGDGHVAVGNCAGCRRVKTCGGPVHWRGLHRGGGVCTRGGGGRVPVCGAVLAGRGRGGHVVGGDAWA